MYRYEVGKLYNENRTKWEEGAEYNFRMNSHEIRLFFRHPKPVEVQAVKNGESNFALIAQEDLILLLFKFGAIPWSDASYTWHRVPEHERTSPPELGEHERSLMTTFMIDADTGMLLVIRQNTLSHEFSVKLNQAIRDQIVHPFDQVIYDRHLRKIYSLSDAKGLLRLASARCKGGA